MSGLGKHYRYSVVKTGSREKMLSSREGSFKISWVLYLNLVYQFKNLYPLENYIYRKPFL